MIHNPGFLKLVEQAKQRVQECSVREDNEYEKDHAKGAVHVGRGVIERDIESLIPDKEAPIILYCGGGYRSVLAAESLQQMGYRHVISMDGGIRAWREANYPIVSGRKK